MWERGPTSKSRKKAWEALGYSSRFHLANATDVGGAIRETRLLVARVAFIRDPSFHWPTVDTTTSPRPMGNLLTPWGLLPRSLRRHPPALPSRVLPHSNTDPMPNCLGALIDSPDGIRRIQADELAKALGCTGLKSERPGALSPRGLRHTTSVFIWESLSSTLSGLANNSARTVDLFTDWDRLQSLPPPPGIQLNHSETTEVFHWAPADLRPGGEWHTKRVASLRAACNLHGPDGQRMFQEGLRSLEIHRENYSATGADLKQLQLLWWEFPREHWRALREGSRLGFLQTPPAVLHDNSDMDEEQLRIAGEFVDELLLIGAIGLPPPGMTVNTTTPLFCVEKPHSHPLEWRVIADCKAGGQNAHMGGDPVYLNRPLHILEQMYTGGYTAVVDASKFFYQFPTHPDDQPHLGVVHPITQKLYIWTGLPMGSGSSPGLAGRYGQAFVRMLVERSKMFASTSRANCWWTSFREEGYDPTRGYGYSLERSDGKPAVKIWVFVDDFAIHGPDYESTSQALRDFLDLAVQVGLLVHPKKLQPPRQVQTYTGFIFDTRGDPTLRIPQEKLERATSMARCVQEHPPNQDFSRLALSVVAGTLESLADATPNRLGHTYLRATHRLIHPEGHDPGRNVYYSSCSISDSVRHEMRWWLEILADRRGRRTRGSRSSTLIPTWGDGSGTGTGGTILLPDRPLNLWMGQWTPAVHHHSSNWKELKTLLLTLQQLATLPREALEGVTVFYFTDNSVTYYVTSSGSSTSPGLHGLVEQIQLLAISLGCFLEVIHVPGVVMIEQGTDGLSRGIWMSTLHPEQSQKALTEAVFAPLAPDGALVQACVNDYHLPGTPEPGDWRYPRGAHLLHRFTVWFPPPELARQCLIGILETWVEAPRTTSALLFIPRTLSRCWVGLSKHLQLLEVFQPSERPLTHPPVLPIPILILYLPPHVPSLPPLRRVDPPSKPAGFRWHDREALRMRGLPGSHPP